HSPPLDIDRPVERREASMRDPHRVDDHSAALWRPAMVFVCPRTGHRAARLHLPPGTYTFASRQAHQLAYPSQRETPPDRALSRAFALRRKLGATGGTGAYIAKPKGMHWRTFERAMARIRRAEDIVDMHEALLLGRLEESFPDKDR